MLRFCEKAADYTGELTTFLMVHFFHSCLKDKEEVLKQLIIYNSIEPNYHNKEDRDKLFSGKGVVISNHTRDQLADVLIILKILKDRVMHKNDVLFFSHRPTEKIYNRFLDGKIISMPKSIEGKRNLINMIYEHIESGGLFFIFPTGGVESKNPTNKDEMFFYRLLFRIINNFSNRDDVMLYNIFINPKDIEHYISTNKQVLTTINVYEKYSTMDKWSDIPPIKNRRERSDEFKKRYLELFNE